MIDIVDMENEAADTAFSAGPDARATLDRLFEGDTWMIFRNVKTGVLHFDFVRTPVSA